MSGPWPLRLARRERLCSAWNKERALDPPIARIEGSSGTPLRRRLPGCRDASRPGQRSRSVRLRKRLASATSDGHCVGGAVVGLDGECGGCASPEVSGGRCDHSCSASTRRRRNAIYHSRFGLDGEKREPCNSCCRPSTARLSELVTIDEPGVLRRAIVSNVHPVTHSSRHVGSLRRIGWTTEPKL